MYFLTFAALLTGALATPLLELDARDGRPSCSVNCTKVQSRCARSTQMASVTKLDVERVRGFFRWFVDGVYDCYFVSLGILMGREQGIDVRRTITSTSTNFATLTSTAPAQTVTKSTTLYAEITSFIATSTSTVYTSTITGTSTTIVNAPDITKCAAPADLSSPPPQKREPGAGERCKEKKPRCFSRQHNSEQISSACGCFGVTAGPRSPGGGGGNGTPVTSTVTSFTTVWTTVQSGSITTLTPTLTTLLPTTSTSTKRLTSTTTLSTITTASVTSIRYAVATAAYQNTPFRILASGGTVTGKYLLTPNPAGGTDFFSTALLVFAADTATTATTFTWNATSNALVVAHAGNPANGYAATILGTGVADKLRAQNFAFQDEEAITCGVVGGPGETCVLQCQNPFDQARESFEDCYQGDRNWMVGMRAGADYGACPLVRPYLVTG
ncbi:hypothetical protein M409DRAFT_58110 [Zasmidium cellare ATCC 36951]|uniref:Uncharacterized protein n=1 Tax=Zasmidium cellare ATCC 36951 TaxID=1080233 RepID=A0A6A6C6M6_ZASCE|nr:uncharacterized protein M409DRAFT_58110 [Zasmidium cellare ATCC 36951]KAF2162701.1 hypothetical protein M409DRAFT_58110 [Zasmidium cellare ATCC 36951]